MGNSGLITTKMYKTVIFKINSIIHLLLFAWPPVRVVCLNHDVVMFQPWTGTPPYLGSVVNFYVSYSTLLNPL